MKKSLALLSTVLISVTTSCQIQDLSVNPEYNLTNQQNEAVLKAAADSTSLWFGYLDSYPNLGMIVTKENSPMLRQSSELANDLRFEFTPELRQEARTAFSTYANLPEAVRVYQERLIGLFYLKGSLLHRNEVLTAEDTAFMQVAYDRLVAYKTPCLYMYLACDLYLADVIPQESRKQGMIIAKKAVKWLTEETTGRSQVGPGGQKATPPIVPNKRMIAADAGRIMLGMKPRYAY